MYILNHNLKRRMSKSSLQLKRVVIWNPFTYRKLYQILSMMRDLYLTSILFKEHGTDLSYQSFLHLQTSKTVWQIYNNYCISSTLLSFQFFSQCCNSCKQGYSCKGSLRRLQLAYSICQSGCNKGL